MPLLDVDCFGKTASDYEQICNDYLKKIHKMVLAANPKIHGTLIRASDFKQDENPEESKELRDSKRRFKSYIEGAELPHDYNGNFTIHADGNLIYEVSYGRITKDTLGLTLDFQCENEFEKKFDAYNRYNQGQQVLEKVKEFTEIAGKRQDDNSLLFEGDNYTFYLNKDQLKVNYKDEDMDEPMEILNNNGYTPYATFRDMRFMNQIKQKMDGFEQRWQSEQAEQEDLKPKM